MPRDWLFKSAESLTGTEIQIISSKPPIVDAPVQLALEEQGPKGNSVWIYQQMIRYQKLFQNIKISRKIK